MQTFMPFPSWEDTAHCLDRPRLGKQRLEGVQLLEQLVTGEGNWLNHPAGRMWSGHEMALAVYTLTICEEWRSRGYRDSICERTIAWAAEIDCTVPIEILNQEMLSLEELLPPWIGLESFHRSHQSNLVRKLPEHYRVYFPDVPNDLPYFWPVPKETV